MIWIRTQWAEASSPEGELSPGLLRLISVQPEQRPHYHPGVLGTRVALDMGQGWSCFLFPLLLLATWQRKQLRSTPRSMSVINPNSIHQSSLLFMPTFCQNTTKYNLWTLSGRSLSWSQTTGQVSVSAPVITDMYLWNTVTKSDSLWWNWFSFKLPLIVAIIYCVTLISINRFSLNKNLIFIEHILCGMLMSGAGHQKMSAPFPVSSISSLVGKTV